MPVYNVIRKSDGQQVYRYNADAPVQWDGMEFAMHDHVEYVEVNSDGSIQGTATVVKRRLTKLEFIGKLGGDFDTLFAASKVNLDAEKFMKMLDWATPEADGTSVDLDDPRVVGALTAFEQAGLIGTGRAQEILNG